MDHHSFCLISIPFKEDTKDIPPSSLAITSALSSTVKAMELLELPKVIPMATRSPGSTPALTPLLSDIAKRVCVKFRKKKEKDEREAENREKRKTAVGLLVCLQFQKQEERDVKFERESSGLDW